MHKFLNVHDVLVIGLTAIIFLFLFNKALGFVGLARFRVSSSGSGAAMPATSADGGGSAMGA